MPDGVVAGEVEARLSLTTAKFEAALAAAELRLKAFRSKAEAPMVLSGAAAGVKGSTQSANAGAIVQTTRNIETLASASAKADAALASVGKSGVRSMADVQVQLKQTRTAFNSLVNQTAKTGGLGALSPEMASKVRGQIESLNGQIVALKNNLKDMGQSVQHSETQFAMFLRTLLKASFVFVGILALKAAIFGLADAIRATIAEAARFEQVQIGFQKLYGGIERAKLMLQDLAEFAARTPFEIGDTEKQALRLKAYGFAAAEVIPILRDVGDAASGLGTGTEGINRITLALGQMRSAGKVNSRDMLQLTESFIPAWQYLAKAMGVTTSKVREFSEKGLIPADKAIKAIRMGMQRDFGGMMKAQMVTLIGQWSNFKDRLTIAARALGTTLLPRLKEFVQIAALHMPRIQAYLEGIVKGTNDTGRALRTVAGAVQVLWGVIQPVLITLRDFVSMWTSLVAGNLGGVFEKMGDSVVGTGLFVGSLIGVIYKLITGVNLLSIAWYGVATSATAAAGAQATAAGGGAAGAGAGGGATGGAAAGGIAGWLASQGGALKVAGKAGLVLALATYLSEVGNSAFDVLMGRPAKNREEAWQRYYEKSGLIPKSVKKIAARFAGIDVQTKEGKAQAAALKREQDKLNALANTPPEQRLREDSTKAWDEYNAAVKKSGQGSKEANAAYTRASDAMRALAAYTDDYTFSVEPAVDATKALADTLKSIDVEGLSTLQDTQKNALDTALAHGSALEALAKAEKNAGKNSAQYASALLDVVSTQNQANSAMELYKQKAIEVGLAQKYSGNIASWAANVAIQGAQAAAAAQDNLVARINAGVEAFNRLAQAAANAAANSVQQAQYEQLAGRQFTHVEQIKSQLAAVKDALKFTPPTLPKVAQVGGGSGGGGGKSAAEKAADAAKKMRDAIADAVKSTKELAARFKEAAQGIANFSGLFDRPEKKRVGGFMGAARSQIKKLTKYLTALQKLKTTLPADVFALVTKEGVSSIDEVIKLARMGSAKAWGAEIQKREALGRQIASITQAGEMTAGRREIVARAGAAVREITPTVNINFGGVTIGNKMSAEEFGKTLSRMITRELRSAGLVGA